MKRCERTEKKKHNKTRMESGIQTEHSTKEEKKNIKTKLESYFQLSIQPITFWF